jgi:hypothetical protein
MNKRFSPWTFAALALCLAAPAGAQSARKPPVQHLAPDAMTVADQTVRGEHQRELVEGARIYGYNLAAGNWSYEQALCASMPDTLLLQYTQRFPDGTRSLFTALVPHSAGHVRIVPVLYRSATAFLPAPKNPHNYALFNEFVVNATINENWFDLGACYAEMTGGRIDLSSSAEESVGIAAAPSPRVQIDAKDKTARVTVASREGVSTYKVWSISFNRNGRVTAASTEDQSVVSARVVQPATNPQTPSQTQAQSMNEPTHRQTETEAASAARQTATAGNTQTTATAPQSASSANESASRPAEQASDAPGWRYILQASNPPSKIVAPAPPPPQKVIPEPPDAWQQSDKTPQ